MRFYWEVPSIYKWSWEKTDQNVALFIEFNPEYLSILKWSLVGFPIVGFLDFIGDTNALNQESWHETNCFSNVFFYFSFLWLWYQDDILPKMMANTGSQEDLFKKEISKYDQICEEIAHNIEEQEQLLLQIQVYRLEISYWTIHRATWCIDILPVRGMFFVLPQPMFFLSPNRLKFLEWFTFSSLYRHKMMNSLLCLISKTTKVFAL